MSRSLHAVVLLLLAGSSLSATAGVYRCVENGKTIYSDRPCQAGQGATVAVPAGTSKPDAATAPPTPAANDAALNLQVEARRGRVLIGQTPAQVELAWGPPRAKNVDQIVGVRTEQWVYDRGANVQYVYFRDGLVSGLSEHMEDPKQVGSGNKAEAEAEERAAKAAERKFIRERMALFDVRQKIGEPEQKTFPSGVLECWFYGATRLDPQTNTTICFDQNSYVFKVERRIMLR